MDSALRHSRGVCATTSMTAVYDCESSEQGAWRLGSRTNISGLSGCVTACHRCRRCAFVAFSARWGECGWFASCEQPLTRGAARDFQLVRVRHGGDGVARRRSTRHRHPCAGQVQGRGVAAANYSSGSAAAALASCSSPRLEAAPLLRVACVGDSNTRGDAAHEPGAGLESPWKAQLKGRGNYPARLQALLGPGYVVANFGRSGVTAAELAHRTVDGGEQLALLRCFQPRVVLLMAGTNDCIPDKARTARRARPHQRTTALHARVRGRVGASSAPACSARRVARAVTPAATCFPPAQRTRRPLSLAARRARTSPAAPPARAEHARIRRARSLPPRAAGVAAPRRAAAVGPPVEAGCDGARAAAGPMAPALGRERVAAPPVPAPLPPGRARHARAQSDAAGRAGQSEQRHGAGRANAPAPDAPSVRRLSRRRGRRGGLLPVIAEGRTAHVGERRGRAGRARGPSFGREWNPVDVRSTWQSLYLGSSEYWCD
eukprot:6584134-Prymnesium_polylepis.4